LLRCTVFNLSAGSGTPTGAGEKKPDQSIVCLLFFLMKKENKNWQRVTAKPRCGELFKLPGCGCFIF
jgi:hypothetical protein